MTRTLMLALFALGIGVFASSLLRTEKAASAGDEPTDAPEPGRCSAPTRSGGRCTRPALAGSDRCWQHGG